ncbi:MAG: hypothetical protein KC502_10105 [Myxococcales bacterium]|nr:hypothetical protein [Myxococcales bacterium]
MHQQMREMVEAGRYQEAVDKGEAFLQDSRQSAVPPEELDKVETLVAEAALRLAHKTDTVVAYRKFRKSIPRTQATLKQHRRAYVYEAAAWYRDMTLRADSLQAHRDFRKRYPRTPSVALSRLRQVEIAFEAAKKTGTMQAFDRFHVTYERWPEAAPVLKKALQLEASVGFSEAVQAASVDRWRAYRARFAKSSWARKAFPYEVAQALAEARRIDTAKAYRSLAARYAGAKGIERYLAEGRRHEVAAAWRELGQLPTDAMLVEFLRRYERWPEATQQGPAARERLAAVRLSVAQRAGTTAALEGFLTLHTEWKGIDRVLSAAKKALVNLALIAAKRDGSRAAFDAFIERFKRWPEGRRAVVEAAGLARHAR